MATIIHKSELVRRALVYIDERRAEFPDKPLCDLMDEAGMRFNLTPRDAEDLERLFQDTPANGK